ncbi:MAG: HEAT repeat domain-containing protein [Nannocystaceae bacterium]
MKYQKHLGRSIALTSALLLCPACQSTTTSEVGVRDNEVLETQQEQTLTPSSEEASIPSFEPTAVGPLHARVASTRWAERKLAQRALLQIKGEQRASSAVDFATRSLQATDPKSLQRSLLAAIALDPEMTVASVVGVLESISPDARDAALRVLVTNPQVNLQPERDALLATATSMVEDPASPASFEVGLAVLAKLADPSATQRISDAIQARDKPTRKSAMAVLQRWAVPGGLDLAIDALNAPEVYVRRRAAAALAMYPSSPVALETLASLIRTETNTRVCTRGLEALAAFPAAQVEPLLVERLSATEGCSTEHTFVTLSVARRVLRRSSVELPALRQAIMTFAAGPSLFGVKAAAIVALGDIEMAKTLTGIDAIDAFGELTSKSLESAEVRKAAIAALGAMNTQEATSRLYRVLEDVELSPGIVAATLVAIEGSGHADQERMTALIPFTAEEEAPELRTLAVSHLARHANDVTSAKRLLALRGDRDPIIMDAAKCSASSKARIFGHQRRSRRNLSSSMFDIANCRGPRSPAPRSSSPMHIAPTATRQ